MRIGIEPIEIAQAAGDTVHLQPLTRAQLRSADEVFITSSGGGLLPVTRVDGVAIGSGRPGPITQRLSDTYWAWHRDPRYSLPVAGLPQGA